VRAAAVVLGLLLSTLVGAEVLLPVPPAARVTDQTGTLTPPQIAALDTKLAAFEAQKGSQIAVLLVPTTAPEDIAAYSYRIAHAWQLGRKGVNDGALIVVATTDHRDRIEVGNGLEGPVPDAYAKRIVSDVMEPYFKQGDFYRGLDLGATQLIGLVNGEPLPPPRPAAQHRRSGNPLQGGLVVVLIGALVLGAVLRAMFGRVFGALATGGVVGAAAWLIALSLGGALLAGFAAFFIALIGDLGRRGFGGMGGFGGIGGGGFGGGLGGGGGGGFGGGGGGFSGGGASGSW
jgi:uncharacterized protein